MTLDTVGTETPACAAMNAMVVPLPDRRPLGAIVERIAGSVATPERKFRTAHSTSAQNAGFRVDAGHAM